MSSCSSGNATSSAARPRFTAAGVSRGRERRALALTLVLALALALDPGVDSFLRLAIIGIVNPERSVLKANGWPGLDSSSSAGAISTPAFNSIEEGHPVRIHRLFAPLALT